MSSIFVSLGLSVALFAAVFGLHSTFPLDVATPLTFFVVVVFSVIGGVLVMEINDDDNFCC